MTGTLRKRLASTRRLLGQKQTGQKKHKILRTAFLISTCLIVFGLLLFTVNGFQSSAALTLDSQSFFAATASSKAIVVTSPKNATYTVSNVSLTFSGPQPASWIGYSLDGNANVTISGNTTMQGLTLGSHYVTVYSNDTDGNMYSSPTIYFTTAQVSLPDMIILGLIQGFGEWLPVSSTAHLLIAEKLLGLTQTAFLDVTLHVGTLVVVVFFFRREIKDVLSALFHLDFKSESGKLIVPIVLATIPTGIIGLLYTKFVAATFQSFLIIGATFLVGAAILYTSKIGKERTDQVTYATALIMGAAQGLASFPGLSRSGITISTALLLGLKRDKAFKFSFLLSIPAIIGDLVVEAYLQRGQLALQTISTTELAISLIITMIAGFIALKLVQNLVRTKRFHNFAFYTAILGITLVALTLTGVLAT